MGKVINRGWAKPNDPIYSTGAMVGGVRIGSRHPGHADDVAEALQRGNYVANELARVGLWLQAVMDPEDADTAVAVYDQLLAGAFDHQRILDVVQREFRLFGWAVTVQPRDPGPAWTLHPHRRLLTVRGENPESLLQGLVLALLARSAWLGKGPCSDVPEHLEARYFAALGRALVAIGTHP